MKKLGFCLMALCLVGYAVGCAKEEQPANNPAPAPEATDGTDDPAAPDAGTDPAADGEGDAN